MAVVRTEKLQILIPGIGQCKAGWGFEIPGLVEDIPAHGSRVGTR